MRNQHKGFSPDGKGSGRNTALSTRDEQTLRDEFEIMQRLDFVFIKELGANTPEEYILKVTELRYSPAHRSAHRRAR